MQIGIPFDVVDQRGETTMTDRAYPLTKDGVTLNLTTYDLAPLLWQMIQEDRLLVYSSDRDHKDEDSDCLEVIDVTGYNGEVAVSCIS